MERKDVDETISDIVGKLADITSELRKVFETKKPSDKYDFSGGDDTWFDYRPDGLLTIQFLTAGLACLIADEYSYKDLADLKEVRELASLSLQNDVPVEAHEPIIWLCGVVGVSREDVQRDLMGSDDPEIEGRLWMAYESGLLIKVQFTGRREAHNGILHYWEQIVEGN